MQTRFQSISSEVVAHFCIRAALPRARAPLGGARGVRGGRGSQRERQAV